MKRFFVIPIAMSVVLTSCSLQRSFYSEVKYNDSYTIEAGSLNSRLSADYELSAGDVIKVGLEVKSGSFEITIGSDDDVIYEGDGAGLSGFSVTIPTDDEYTISVEGKNGAGRLEFEISRQGDE